MNYFNLIMKNQNKKLDQISKFAFSGLFAAFVLLFLCSLWQMVRAESLESMMFEEMKNPALSYQEQQALQIAQDWQSGKQSKAIKPINGADGAISFVFGANQTPIVCAPLQICDLTLQVGEQVNTINLGDSSRWIIEPAITGSEENQTTHLIIKPLDVGLTTSLMIATNRRSYHLQLKSHETQYMPKVNFIYPSDALAKWQAIKANRDIQQAQAEIIKQAKKQDLTIKATGEYLGDLDFNYRIDGKANWKPVRVYNDGVKTIIEMPKSISLDSAPSLMVLHKKSALFRAEKINTVSYRVHGNRYVVDGIFKHIVLMAGVGRSQDRITITRE